MPKLPPRLIRIAGWIAGVAVALYLLAALGLWIFQRPLTALLEGDQFRAMLEKETAKGMHFEEAHYAPIQRVGVFGMKSASGEGDKGLKTIVSLKGSNVTASFNPWGVFLRRWQIDHLHFTDGTVKIQKTEGSGTEKAPGMPWYLFFWPDRVYLSDTTCDHADVLFDLRGKESGIYDTYLEITPNGRDFEYDARGGTFKTPMSAPLTIEHCHLLIRKPRLTCEEFVLQDDPKDHPEERVTATGTAGLQQDRSIQIHVGINALNVPPWLPPKLQDHVLGHLSGQLDYHSTGTGLETASGSGSVAVADAILRDLKPIRTYIAATKCPDPGDLKLSVCKLDLEFKEGAITAKNIEVQCDGVFRLTGQITIQKDQTLTGEVQLGLTDPYIAWLPTARQDIFNTDDGPYRTTTVHLSGTAKKPQQDLSTRLTTELSRHPFVALKLFFNSASEWFDFD
jgi:hypothetical protein